MLVTAIIEVSGLIRDRGRGGPRSEEPIYRIEPTRPKKPTMRPGDPCVPMEPLTHFGLHFVGLGVENPARYKPGGYHPVHLGDVYRQRYKVIHKLGFGTYLARDLQSTVQT